MNSYTLEIEAERWRIVYLERGWFLKRRMVTPDSGTTTMTPVGIFVTAEEAAEAVADGTTGESDWDLRARDKPRTAYLLAAWKVDPPYESRTPWRS